MRVEKAVFIQVHSAASSVSQTPTLLILLLDSREGYRKIIKASCQEERKENIAIEALVNAKHHTVP